MTNSTLTPPAKTNTKGRTKKVSTLPEAQVTEATAVAAPEAKEVKQITSAYQLQKRVMLFAVSIRAFTEKLPKQLEVSEDAQQLIASSGKLGMHAIQASEAPSKKAFTTNMQFCRKEVKEALYWLQLIDRNLSGYTERRRQELYTEAHELRRIFTAICKTAVKNG